MKIRSAKKSTTKKKITQNESILLRKNDDNASDLDLLDVEIISAPSVDNSSGRLDV